MQDFKKRKKKNLLMEQLYFRALSGLMNVDSLTESYQLYPSLLFVIMSEPFENTPFIVTVRGETLLMLQLSGEFEKRTGMQK